MNHKEELSASGLLWDILHTLTTRDDPLIQLKSLSIMQHFQSEKSRSIEVTCVGEIAANEWNRILSCISSLLISDDHRISQSAMDICKLFLSERDTTEHYF